MYGMQQLVRMNSFMEDLEAECERLEKGIKLIKSVWSLAKEDQNKTKKGNIVPTIGRKPNVKRQYFTEHIELNKCT